MRMLVLGAGLQGSACAYDLLQNAAVERVTLGDQLVDTLPPFLDIYHDDPRLRLERVDARDRAAVRALMQGHDACLNALPYYLNLAITEEAIAGGLHYCDLGGNTDIVFQQIELDGAARERHLSVIPDSGLAPGMVNVLAELGIRELDDAASVRIKVGGLPQDPEPPLDYQIVYSLHGVLD
ncbi:MAG TPA: saccharopine dehydrogenase NADP-binding domain-containing protein, partial [Longimicrobiales bacterium]